MFIRFILILFQTFFLRFKNSTIIPTAKHVFRVCEGPSCSKYSNEIHSQLSDAEQQKTGLFEVAYSPCLNACKRSCNVALVPKGDFCGCYVPGMTSVEKAKLCFNNINNAEDIDRVLHLVNAYLRLENEVH